MKKESNRNHWISVNINLINDDVQPFTLPEAGLNEAVIRELSAAKMNQNGCSNPV